MIHCIIEYYITPCTRNKLKKVMFAQIHRACISTSFSYPTYLAMWKKRLRDVKRKIAREVNNTK